jgi:acetoacetate decarboxylase
MMVKAEGAYPPEPWKLNGCLLFSPSLVDVRQASVYVPDRMDILSIGPGKTLGGVLLVKYESGSTLQYNELIIFSSLVRKAGKTGLWVSHIYVDDEVSRRGGRELFGLPKELADFDWQFGRITVSQNGNELLRYVYNPSRLLVGVPFRLWAMGGAAAQVRGFQARGIAKGGLAGASVTVFPSSPFHSLQLDTPLLSVEGRQVEASMGGIRTLDTPGE